MTKIVNISNDFSDGKYPLPNTLKTIIEDRKKDNNINSSITNESQQMKNNSHKILCYYFKKP